MLRENRALPADPKNLVQVALRSPLRLKNPVDLKSQGGGIRWSYAIRREARIR
jgi:hypothetical protein